MENKRVKLIIRYYPIALTFIGVLIHTVGLLGFQMYLSADFTLHLVMLLVDTLVVIGLYKQTRWGFWLALALYFQQSICQSYWAYTNYVDIKSSWPHIGALILIVISFFVLLRFKGSIFCYNRALG